MLQIYIFWDITPYRLVVFVRMHDPKNEDVKIFRSIGKFYQLTRLKNTENLNFSMLRYLTAGDAVPILTYNCFPKAVAASW